MPNQLLKGKQLDIDTVIDALIDAGFDPGTGNEIPFYCVKVGESRTVPNCIENRVKWNLTNCGEITNCGRIIID